MVILYGQIEAFIRSDRLVKKLNASYLVAGVLPLVCFLLTEGWLSNDTTEQVDLLL